MSEKIVQLNEEIIKGQIKELVRGSVEETLNKLLEAEAEKLTQAVRYERSEARQGCRSDHYYRNLTTTSEGITIHMPHLNGGSFFPAETIRRIKNTLAFYVVDFLQNCASADQKCNGEEIPAHLKNGQGFLNFRKPNSLRFCPNSIGPTTVFCSNTGLGSRPTMPLNSSKPRAPPLNEDSGDFSLRHLCADVGLRTATHISGTQWGSKKLMNMKHLEAAFEDTSIVD